MSGTQGRVEKSIVYIGILNHKNEPLYNFNFEDAKLSTDLQLLTFSSLDYFDISRRSRADAGTSDKDRAGGFLGCGCLGTGMYYCYGHVFGTRIKIVIICDKDLGSSQEDQQALKRVDWLGLTQATSAIHELYVTDKMNPLGSATTGYSETLNTQILQYRHRFD